MAAVEVPRAKLKRWLLWSAVGLVLVGGAYGLIRLTGHDRSERSREAPIKDILLTADPRQTSLEGLSAQLDRTREETKQLKDDLGRLAGQMAKTIEGVRDAFQRELAGDRNRSDADRQRDRQKLDQQLGRLQQQVDGGTPAAADTGEDVAGDQPPGPATDPAATPARRGGQDGPPPERSGQDAGAGPAAVAAAPGTSPLRRGGTQAPAPRRTGDAAPGPRRQLDGALEVNLPGSTLPRFPQFHDQAKPEDQLFARQGAGPTPALGDEGGARRGTTPAAAAAKVAIRIIGSDVPGNQPAVPKADDVYTLPATSLLTGTLITGLDASTAQQSKRDPFPVLVRVQKTAILPNRYQADVRECFVLMAGYGDLSSERAYMRGETISCVLTSGKVIETRLEGYAAGEDGKAGVRGTLVTKQGQFIARALLVGFLQGAAEVFSKGDSITFGVSQSNTDQPNPWGTAAMKGTGNALDRIAEFYIDQAYNLFPVIEIDAGRQLDIVLTGHVDMPLPNS